MNSVLNTLTTIHIEYLAEFHTVELWNWNRDEDNQLIVEGIEITFDTPALQYNPIILWEFVTFKTPAVNGVTPISWKRSEHHMRITDSAEPYSLGYVIPLGNQINED